LGKPIADAIGPADEQAASCQSQRFCPSLGPCPEWTVAHDHETSVRPSRQNARGYVDPKQRTLDLVETHDRADGQGVSAGALVKSPISVFRARVCEGARTNDAIGHHRYRR